MSIVIELQKELVFSFLFQNTKNIKLVKYLQIFLKGREVFTQFPFYKIEKQKLRKSRFFPRF